MSDNDQNTEQPRPNGSTGPVTPEGKAKSAANSFKHGFTGQSDVVQESDKKEYEVLRDKLLQQIQPRDVLQFLAFNDMVHAAWNKIRIRRIENHYFDGGTELLEKPEVRKTLELLHRYLVRHERTYFKALKTIQELQTESVARTTLPAEANTAYPPMANAMKIHIAKRTGDKTWTPRDREALRKYMADYEASKRAAAGKNEPPSGDIKQ